MAFVFVCNMRSHRKKVARRESQGTAAASTTGEIR